MPRTKRTSTDALDAHLKRAKAISWPARAVLPDDPDAAGEVLDYFASIVESRSASDWSTAELLLASNLSNCQYMIGQAQSDVFRRGLTLQKEGSKGQLVEVINPASDVLNRLLSQAGSLASKLSIPAGTGAGKVNKASLKNQAAANPARITRGADDQPRRLWKDRPQ